MSDGLIAFLRARLAEFERAANLIKEVYPTPWEVSDRGWMARVVADKPNFLEVVRLEQEQAPDADWLGWIIEHISLNNPDFVLADVAAKREIITVCAGTIGGNVNPAAIGDAEYVLQLMGVPFSSHPDYRSEWKP